MSDAAVLIVGAGPVGLTLAVECHRHGVQFRLIEKNPAPSDKSKALGVWSGTIECLAAMGVVDEFLARSMPLQGLIFNDTGAVVQHTSLHEGIESVYPVPFLLPQYWTEEILTNRLREAGIEIERGVELIALKNEATGVEATLRHADGTLETTAAQWLAGCDGAHSCTRHQLPVEFPGITEETAFLLLDGKIEGELPDDHISINWGPTCVCVFFPIKKGIFRMFTQRADTTNHEPPTLEEMNDILRANGLGRLKLYDPEWRAFFSVNERYASRARVGRVFLLGDAAHIHSPAGGQGMNTGMQDAFNLGWKLGLLTRGQGDLETLAESFHAERHPVAKALIDKTTKLLHFGMANNAFIRAVKDVAIKFVFQSRFVQSKVSGEFSELHISYPVSPLVVPDTAWPNHGGFAPGVKPRDAVLQHPVSREPISLWRQFLEPAHTLVIFSGKDAKAETVAEISAVAEAVKIHGRAVRVVVVWIGSQVPVGLPPEAALSLDPNGDAHEQYGLEYPGWYLVRPDQYLAARAATLETASLLAYLRKAVG
jgi:2-polyprenyl-6-methoxyphenol hydroxylase-like FAD-dependent oxidoreductase